MQKNMKNLIIIILGLGIVVAVFFSQKPVAENDFEKNGNEQEKTQDVVMQKFQNDGAGIGFEYRVQPDGYTLTGDVDVRDDNSVTEYRFYLTATEEHLSYLSRMPGEGGPGISIRVFENKENLSLKDWTETKTMESNYHLAFTPMRDTSVGGVPAVTYERDGLYAGTAVVASHNNKIYIIDGDNPDPESKMKADFNQLLQSIWFF